MEDIQKQITDLKQQEADIVQQRYELEQGLQNRKDIADLDSKISEERNDRTLLYTQLAQLLIDLEKMSLGEYVLEVVVEPRVFNIMRPKGLTETDIVYSKQVKFDLPYIIHTASSCRIDGYVYRDVSSKQVRYKLSVPFDTSYSINDTIDASEIDAAVHTALTMKLSKEEKVGSMAALKQLLIQQYPDAKIGDPAATVLDIPYFPVSFPNGIIAYYTYTAGSSDVPGSVLPELLRIDISKLTIDQKKQIIALFSSKTQ